MVIVIHTISVDNILKSKGTEGIKKYLSLINPQVFGSDILFDVVIDFAGDVIINNKNENKTEYIRIQLGQQGELKFKTADFESIELM